MRRSARTLREHLVVDAFGVSFMQGMWDWMEGVLRDGAANAS
jgi:hypothetical protein